MFEFLDNPRKAVWNLGRGVSDMMSGEAPDLGDIIPGAGGLMLGTALAGTGIGIPLAILAGSLAGGTAQSAIGNEAMSPGQFLEQHLDVDPESTGGAVSSMLLGAATDPLSFAIPTVPGRLGAIEKAGKGIKDWQYERQMANQFSDMPVRSIGENRLGQQANAMRSVEPGELAYNNFRNPKPLLDDASARMSSGAFASPDDLPLIQKSLEEAGLLSRMLDPGTRASNQAAVLKEMQGPALDQALMSMMEPGAVRTSFPLGRSVQSRIPTVELGQTMRGNVPLPPDAIAEALQSNPEIMKQLLSQASIPAPSGGLAAFKTQAAQQKYLSQLLSEMLSEHSFSNFKSMMPNVPIPAEYLATMRPPPGV